MYETRKTETEHFGQAAVEMKTQRTDLWTQLGKEREGQIGREELKKYSFNVNS